MKFKQHEIDTDTTETKNLLMKFQKKLCVEKELEFEDGSH